MLFPNSVEEVFYSGECFQSLQNLKVKLKVAQCVWLSRRSSQPRDRTQVSCITGGFFTSWATREAQEYWSG